MSKKISGLKSSDFRPLRINMQLFPLAPKEHDTKQICLVNMICGICSVRVIHKVRTTRFLVAKMLPRKSHNNKVQQLICIISDVAEFYNSSLLSKYEFSQVVVRDLWTRLKHC